MRYSSISLICVSPCNDRDILQIIMLFIQQVQKESELLFVDNGKENRSELIATLCQEDDLKKRITYLYDPQCTTAEDKVALAAKYLKGDLWHFITPDVCYPENYFNTIVKMNSGKIQGSTTRPVYLPALNALRGISSRSPYFSHLSTLCINRQHYNKYGIWFNVQEDEASPGKPFTSLPVNKCPVKICEDIVEATEKNIISCSEYLPLNQSSIPLIPALIQHNIDWSFFEKIVYINLSSRPDRAQQLIRGLQRLNAPEEKIIRYDAIADDVGAVDCTRSHIAVLKMAREQQWRNVLILEDDIHFVQTHETDRQLNNFLSVLKKVAWDVGLLSANYHNVTFLSTQENIVKVNKAFTAGSYVVNAHYYDTLIANYEQGLQLLHNSNNRQVYALDNYWNLLVEKDCWLGLWPCFSFRANGYSDIERASLDYIPVFFRSRASIHAEKMNKLEAELIASCDNNTATCKDYTELQQLYSARGMFELADYFQQLASKSVTVAVKDKNWPLLSVIIPTYNQSANLMRTLESIRRQRYPNMEIVVMDDCSTDDTNTQLASIKDPRLTVVRNAKNLGGAQNLKQAFQLHTQGKYVYLIDHDDLLLDRDYLMDAVMFLEQDPSLAFVYASHYEWREQQSQVVRSFRAANKAVINGKTYFKKYLHPGYPNVLFLSSVFRRTAAEKTDAFVDDGIADIHLFLRMMLAGNVGFMRRIPSAYRIHPKSITFNMNKLTDVYIDRLFISHMEETMSIASRHGHSHPQLQKWFNRMVKVHFAGWRMPIALQNENFALVTAILSLLHQRYPDLAASILAELFAAKR